MRHVTGRAGWVTAWVLIGAAVLAVQAQVVVIDGADQPRRESSASSSYIEDSPAAEEIVEQARHLERQGRRSRAALKYQQVIDQYAGKLLASADGRYTDAARWVRRVLRADAELLEAYRQGHEAVAARALDQAAAARGADPAALAQVFDRFTLCRAGLEAGLSLAAIYLERAQWGDAAVVLDELAAHPDLPASATRWHQLQAAAGLFGDEAGRAERHRQALRDLGDAAAVAQLDAWTNQVRRPQTAPTIALRQPSPVDAWPQVPDTALWQVHTRTADPTDPDGAAHDPEQDLRAIAGRGQRTRIVPPAPMLPLVQGGRLYLNDGVTVTALERRSGRPEWRYRGRPSEQPMDLLRSSVWRGAIHEPRSVALSDRSVVAVVGRATPSRRGVHQRSDQTWLVSLNQRDGGERWRARPGDLDETLSRGFFHGTPIAHQGRIYVPVRRTQLSRFQGALVVAVDASTGKLLWRRYLSSAAAPRDRSTPLLTDMLLDHGRLFVNDHLGAIACLDSRTGSVLWLTTTTSDLDRAPRRRSTSMPAATTAGNAPILTEAGLIVTRLGDRRQAWLLDPTTGEKLDDLSASTWSKARYILPASQPCTSVVTVSQKEVELTGGETVRREVVQLIDGETLTPQWEYDPQDPESAAPDNVEIGRPVITRKHVAVPFDGQLHVLALDTGQLVARQRLVTADPAMTEPTPGDRLSTPPNVLALPDQLVVTDVTRAYGHIPVEHAAAELRRLNAAADTDHSVGLALAHLALVTARWPMLLEGADMALAALQRRADARRAAIERPGLFGGQPTAVTTASGSPDDPADDTGPRQVFDFLRLLLDRDGGATAGVSVQAYRRIGELELDAPLWRELFARLAAAAVGPGDVVAYRLALGRFLTDSGEPGSAVDEYQAVLSDPVLSRQPVKLSSGSRQAGLEARMRLRALVEEYGADIYAQYEALASDRLAELTATEGTSAAAFLALAERFPLALAAPAARTAGSAVLARQGQAKQAVHQLSRAYAETRTTELRQRIVGQLVELLAAGGRTSRARQWLRRVRREYPDLQPLRAGTPVSIEQWLTDLVDPRAPQSRLPQIMLPLAEPYALPGRLLTPTAQGAETWPRDVILTHDGQAVHLRAGRKLAIRWSLPVSNAHVQLLAATSEQVLLWSPPTGTLTAVNVGSGKPVWVSGDVRDFLDRVEAGPRIAVREEVQRALIRGGARIGLGRVELGVPVVKPGLRLAVGETIVCIAHGDGRIVALDRRGGHLLWQYRCGVAQLTHLVVDDDVVAVAGYAHLSEQSREGSVFLIDARTGQQKLPPWREHDPIGWLGVSDLGLLLYATAKGAAAIDLAAGEMVWRLPLEGQPMSGLGATGDGHLLLHDAAGALLFVDAGTGHLTHQFEMPGTAMPPVTAESIPRLHVRQVGAHWHLLTPWQAQGRYSDGQLAWRDAISGAKRRLGLQLIGAEVVALAAVAGSPASARQALPERAAPTYRLYVLDRDGGAIRAECDLPTAGRPLDPNAAVCLDRRFVLSTDTATIVVPDALAAPP